MHMRNALKLRNMILSDVVLAEQMLLDYKERTLLVSRAFRVATIEVLSGYFTTPIESDELLMIG